MAWDAVRTALAQALGTVAITSPAAQSIKATFEHPPESVQEFPSFVIAPPDEVLVERLSGTRVETVTVRCRFMCLAGDNISNATKIAVAFREATIAMFDHQVTLKGTGGSTNGILLSEKEGPVLPGNYGGTPVIIFEATLEIHHETQGLDFQ